MFNVVTHKTLPISVSCILVRRFCDILFNILRYDGVVRLHHLVDGVGLAAIALVEHFALGNLVDEGDQPLDVAGVEPFGQVRVGVVTLGVVSGIFLPRQFIALQ